MIDLEAARIRLEEATLLKDVHSVPFKFRALGGTRLEELQALHPPTEKQTKEFKAQLKAASMPQNAQLPYNSDTYPPALIAAACIEPTFTLEQAQELWTSENWSQGERIVIFQAAISVNNQVK
jgi:anion-transporting  ArsA/GET3 family ATPase